MSIEASVRLPRNVNASIRPPQTLTSNIKTYNVANSKLEDLLNVDEDENGLVDGYTLVYDVETETWITVPPDTANLDGGTY